MNIHHDINIISKCIEEVLRNINCPGFVPVFMFEIYLQSSYSNSLLLKVTYPEPFPPMYEGLDICNMVCNLYNYCNLKSDINRTFHTCEPLLDFTPECSEAFEKKLETMKPDIELERRIKVCQYKAHEYNVNCSKLLNKCSKIAVIVCAEISSVIMSPAT